MDKLLAHIDIAQESGTANPTAGSTRVAARTSGQVVTRSSAGVESALGGALSVVSAVLSAAFTDSTPNTLTPITGLSVSIPPNKTAKVIFNLLATGTGTGTIAGNTGSGVIVSNPAGSNASVVVTWRGKIFPTMTGAAGAAAFVDGDTISVAANASGNASIIASVTPSTANVNVPSIFILHIFNASTTTSCTAQGLIQQYNATTLNAANIGSSIFAIIT